MLFPCWILYTFAYFQKSSSCAVTNMAVFYSSFISRFPGILLRYFLKHFFFSDFSSCPFYKMPWFGFCIAHVSAFILRFLCFRIGLSSFFITYLSPENAKSNRIHVSVCLIMDYGVRFIVMDGSVCLHCWFHNMCTLPSFQNMFTVILLSKLKQFRYRSGVAQRVPES